MGNIQEPDNMTRVTASVTGETEKKRLGWSRAGRGQEETLGLHPPPPEAPLVLNPFTVRGSLKLHLLSCL